MTPDAILKEGLKIFVERGQTHGEYHRSLSCIAVLWTAYLEARKRTSYSELLSARDVAHMLCLLKIARSLMNPHNDDNPIDAAVYEAMAGAL